MSKQTVLSSQSGNTCRGKINDNFAELYGQLVATPPNTRRRFIYASQLPGIAQNSDIDVGGGSDDTDPLDGALEGGNLVLVIDGVSKVSAARFHAVTHFPALQLYSNTTIIILPGCGLFLDDDSNVPIFGAGYVLAGGDAAENIAIIGWGKTAILNCNGANQTKETEEKWWPYGVSFYNYTNLLLENLEVRNACTYAFNFSAGQVRAGENGMMKNCRAYWVGGGGPNNDGWHLHGTLDGFRNNNFYSNGGDDTLALNFDEGVLGYEQHVSPGSDYPVNSQFIFDPSSGGDLKNIFVDGVLIGNGAPALRVYVAGSGAGTGVGDNISIKNLSTENDDPARVLWQGPPTIGKFALEGWNIPDSVIPIGAVTDLTLSRITNRNTHVILGGTSYDGISGDYFAPCTKTLRTAVSVGNTSLTGLTEMAFPVANNSFYKFRAVLFTTSVDPGGVKASIDCGIDVTSILFEATTSEGGVSVQERSTTAGDPVGENPNVTAATITIEGHIRTAGAGWDGVFPIAGGDHGDFGTLTVLFARQTGSGTASVVLPGSWFELVRLPVAA